MKAMSAVEFRNRQMEVKVFDLCEPCGQLREDVKDRESAGYWPKYHLKITSCAACYETARRNAIAGAEGLIIC